MPPGGSSRIIASRGHSFNLTTFTQRCAARRQNPLGAPRWTDAPPATPAIRLPGRASNSLCDSAVTGLVWLPNWLSARYLRSGELVPVLSQIRLLPSEIHAVWPHSRYLPAKTRAAIDILLTQMPSQLPGS
ncbi:hypothetical protein C5188_09955 [Serratia liquefaciens]|nr:hypothetical protein C5188_09955 [Serratia liquefaciens]QHT50625.1 hypothetical protein C5686_009930 [Serratia liquefaciens]